MSKDKFKKALENDRCGCDVESLISELPQDCPTDDCPNEDCPNEDCPTDSTSAINSCPGDKGC